MIEMTEYISDNAENRPMVLLGLPFRDTWYISPGNSYISKLIKDAGGNYLWESTESSVSMPLGLENVYMRSLKADYWLNIGSVTSKSEILSLDPRLGSIPPFSTGIYITITNGSLQGEEMITGKAVLLIRILSLRILHQFCIPGLFGNYELVYYRKIE